jgi:predicted lipid-binding transport protein (Tim44 family)
MGYNMGQAAGPQLFNPESQTGMGSIYGAYNSQMNLAAAQAQANAAKSAGKSSMMGSLGGGLLAGGGMIGGAMILA